LNGIDIEQLDAIQYMELFSAVMQDYQLYSFTVLDNLLFKENPDEKNMNMHGIAFMRSD